MMSLVDSILVVILDRLIGFVIGTRVRLSYGRWSCDGPISHPEDSMETSESIEYTRSRGDARYVFTPRLAHRSAPDIVQHSSSDVVEVSETVPDFVESGLGKIYLSRS